MPYSPRYGHRAIHLSALLVGLATCAGQDAHLAPNLALSGIAPDSLASIYVDAAVVGHRIAYLAATAPFVSVLDSNGTVVRQFGEIGEGPGQFEAPSALTTIDSMLAVWEPNRRRLTLFDTGGQYRRTIPFAGTIAGTSRNARTNFFSHPSLLRAIGSTWVVGVYPNRVAQPVDQLALSLVRFAAGGQHADTVWQSAMTASTTGQPTHPVELLPVPLWATCPNGEIMTFDPATQELRKLSPDGAPGGRFSAPPSRVPLSAAGIERNVGFQVQRLLLAARQPLPKDFDQIVRAAAAENSANGMYPEGFQGFAALLCSDGGVVWLETFSLEDSPLGNGRSWLVLGPHRPTQTVIFPVGFRPLVLSTERAYGVILDSLTEETPAWVALPADLASPPQ